MINLGANVLGIGIAIRLNNQFSAQARNVSNSFNAMYGNYKNVIQANLQATRRLGAGMMIAGGIGANGFRKAYEAAADYGFIMKTIQLVTGASQAQFLQMDKVVKNLGTNTIYTIEEVASAMEYLVRSGFTVNQAMAALPGVVYLGVAGGKKAIGNKGGIADTMAAILHEFNMAASESTRLSDLLGKAANISASDVEDLGQALKYSSGTAHILGMDVTEALAVLTTLSNAGLKGGVAGRAFNNMMVYMSNAVGQFRSNRQMDAFKAIGLSMSDIVDGAGNLKPIIGILDAFKSKMEGLGNTEKVSILSALFNMRGSRAMIPLLEKSLKIGYDFAGNLKQLQNGSKDYSKNISAQLMETPKGVLDRITDSLYLFKVEIGTMIEPVITPILKGLTLIIGKLTQFAKTPVGKAVGIMLLGLTAVTAVAGAFLVVFSSIALLATASKVSFANMGRTLVWVWNSAAAAAARYMTVAQGASWVGPNGTFTMKGKKGFFSSKIPGAAGSAAGAGGAGKGLWSMLSGSLRLNTAFTYLTRTVGLVSAGLAIVVGFAGYFFGFMNMIKGVGYVIGTVIQALWGLGEFIWNVLSGNFYEASQVFEKFSERNDHLKKQLNFQDPDRFKSREAIRRQNVNNPYESSREDFMREINARRAKTQPVILNIDGKKVGNVIMQTQEEAWKAMLSQKIN